MIGAFGRFEYALASRYRIERELGRGGMATVYLAHDVRHSRPVALKLMQPGQGGERFLSEIRVTAGLAHAGIMPLYDSGEADGVPFFVMPYLGGETLRERLARTGPLTLEDALAFAEQLAAALDYAHRRGVVHRDVKPENVLLAPTGEGVDRERAVLMDLGVARALATPPEERLTGPDGSPGTPLYMAPEQVQGARDVDGRADQYALASVLYEMLAGEPPFPSRTAPMRRVTTDAPDVRSTRASVPAAVASAIARGLSRIPADRYRSCGDLAATLRTVSSATSAETEAVKGGGAVAPPMPRPSWVAPPFVSGRSASIALVLLFALLGATRWRNRVQDAYSAVVCWVGCPRLDENRYAVFPFQVLSGEGDALQADVQLHDALDRWHDIEPVEPILTRATWARRDSTVSVVDDALAEARRIEAGRYIIGDVTQTGEVVRLSATLRDANDRGRVLSRATVVVRRDSSATMSFHLLADSLLFRRRGGVAEIGGTRVLAAQQAYLLGYEAIAHWDLRTADSLFALAVRRDEAFARARLWLAQVRSWHGEPAALWVGDVQRAHDRASVLAPHEVALATALLHLARERYPEACAVYDSLYVADSLSFEASFGRGECRRLDDVVLANPASPSGWAFRSSSHAAVRAYVRAFQLIPASNAAFRDQSFERVRVLLKTRGFETRRGRAAAGGLGGFLAYPAWDTRRGADTLVFVPYREVDPRWQIVPPTLGLALERNRALFLDIARGWRRSAPESADAAESHALALNLVGDASAVDEIARARTLAADSTHALRLAATAVWFGMKFGLGDTLAIALARRLGDSLVSRPSCSGVDACGWLASTAALVGDGSRAARFARLGARARTTSSGGRVVPLPRTVVAEVWSYRAHAASGLADSLAVTERRMREAIRGAVAPSDAPGVAFELLRDAASLAFVATGRLPEDLPHDGFPLLAVQAALVAGDSARARRLLATVQTARALVPVSELTADTRLVEVDLLRRLGRSADARAWADAWLAAASRLSSAPIGDPLRLAPFARLVRLRAAMIDPSDASADAARWRSLARAIGEGERSVR